MDPVEIFGTALLAIAAAGSAIAISVGLTLANRFNLRKKSESDTRIEL